MNFLFVDRILESIPGKRIIGLKHVTHHDVYLQPNADQQMVLLPCIVGEALGQLGAWNVMECNNFTQRPVAGVVGEVRLFGETRVGDTLLLETIIDDVDEQVVRYHSVATVNGKKILTLEHALGPFLPMERFNDPEQVKAQFTLINRPGEVPNFPEGKNQQMVNRGACQQISYDRILSWDKSKEVVAQKNISFIAPYFVDHFPRNPVFPLSLLLQCKLQLAVDFLRDIIGEKQAAQYVPHSIRKVKMNDFVLPGDMLMTTLMLRQAPEDQFMFRFRSEVANKRVCLGEIIFTKNKF